MAPAIRPSAQDLSMTTRTINDRSFRLVDVLLAPVMGAYGLICSTARHNQRVHRVEYLNRLSDAQLAQRGLCRKDIVRHVYRGTARS